MKLPGWFAMFVYWMYGTVALLMLNVCEALKVPPASWSELMN